MAKNQMLAINIEKISGACGRLMCCLKYEDEIYQLKKENSFLRKVINTFQKTVDKFIHWVCSKFLVSSEEEFIRDFQIENDTYLDPEKQIGYEEELEYEEME